MAALVSSEATRKSEVPESESLSRAFNYVNTAPLRELSRSDQVPPILELEARRTWVLTQHGPNTFTSFIIRRRREPGRSTVTYEAIVEREGASDVIMSARRWQASRSVQLVFSLVADDLEKERAKRGPHYLGKLKVVSDSVHILYDSGDRGRGTRTELAVVIYNHEPAASDTICEPRMVRI